MSMGKLLAVVAATAAGFVAIGCEPKGEMLRTPEQWRDEVAVQMTALIPQFRDCYAKSKAGWAEYAKQMAGSPSVSSTMQPKPRETISITLTLDTRVSVNPELKATVLEGIDQIPKEDQSRDGNLQQCVEDVARKNVKAPSKSDTNGGDGAWHITFVPGPGLTPGAPPPPPPPAPKS